MALLAPSLHPKLTNEAIVSLRSKKIYTVFDFASEEPEKLMRITEFSYKEILQLKQTICHSFGGKVRKGSELLNSTCNNVIATGISSLDDLLEGGLSSGKMYEFCGLSSSGKSQLCHTIATNVAQNSQGIVHYIDTKRDFCGARIALILETKKCDDEEMGRVMDRIKVTRVQNKHELFNFMHHLKSSLEIRSENNPPTQLIIIDSLPAIFFQSSGNPNNHDSNYALNHLSNIAKYLAYEFNVPVITVNLVNQWRKLDGFLPADENPEIVRPALGKYWLHIPSTRLLVQKTNKELRKISVWNSCQLRINSFCVVDITDAGVV